jgi:YjbE family integral membrane protein
MWSQPFDFSVLAEIIWLNLLLSSDNVVAIGIVAHRLAPTQKRQAIIGGAILAILARILLTFLVASVMAVPGIRLVAGLLLLVVAGKLCSDEAEGDGDKRRTVAGSVGQAMVLILAADLLMSLDNVLAVAAICRGDVRLLGLGLGLSIAFIMTCGSLVAKVMDRWPWVAYAGSGFLGYVASRMLMEDRFVSGWLPGLHEERWAVSAAIVVLVLAVPFAWRWRRERRREARGGRPRAYSLWGGVVLLALQWPVGSLRSESAPTTYAASAGPGSGDSDLPYRIYVTSEPGEGRRQRGDWESPDALLVAYTGHWPDSLADLISTAMTETKIILLADPFGLPGGELAEWSASHGLDLGNIDIVWTELDSPWVRDYGPLQLADAAGDPVWLDADYSVSRPNDDVVSMPLSAVARVPVERFDVGLDGGAIISNGEGLCGSTVEYFDKYRIPMEEDAFREWFLSKIGCRTLVLVPALAHEDTHHIDMFAQFLSPGVVALGDFDADAMPEDARRMAWVAEAFRIAAERVGLQLSIARVVLPYLIDGGYRPYLNGLRLPTQFVVPSYGDVPAVTEEAAYEALSRALPGACIVPVVADEMIRLDGAIHCMSLGLSLPRDAAQRSL